MGHISLLLGAGFSVNKGYPTAGQLNDRITALTDKDFSVSTGGTLVISASPFEQDPFWYSSYYKGKLFTLALIDFYKQRHVFDYEKFYDYYQGLYKNEITDNEFDTFFVAFKEANYADDDALSMLYGHNNLFNQIIDWQIRDSSGNKYYRPVHHSYYYPGYTGFLNCLKEWSDENIVHIHTLNHDLLFEDFNHSDWVMGGLSNGFEELGSPYYGKIQGEFATYNVRLPYFSNVFDTKLRLYKLHGSLDQYPFHTQEEGVTAYIKIKPDVSEMDLYKEVKSENGQLAYIQDWINTYSDFLSGTTSKILRYKEPPYYESIFQRFVENLELSSSLVVIGYGCLDSEINNMIDKHFKGKVIFIVEPYPGENTFAFREKYGARLIQKTPNDLVPEDFFED
jgi:hypothetical protein